MTEGAWLEQYGNSWSKEGSFDDLLDLLEIPAADKDLFCELVGFPTNASAILESLEKQGKGDMAQRLLDACPHACGTMHNAMFMARLRMIHESFTKDFTKEDTLALRQQVEEHDEELRCFLVRVQQKRNSCQILPHAYKVSCSHESMSR